MDTKRFREILFPVIILTGIVLFFVQEFGQKEIETTEVPIAGEEAEVTEDFNLCFAEFGEQSADGLYDKYTLSISIDNQNKTVSGELKFLPVLKDSKIGKFEGTISDVNDYSMARTINAVWDTMAEGMNTKEELKIVFGEGVASILLDEMVEGENGIYIYKNPNSTNYNLELTDISCDELKEREVVEDYIRKNISTLSPVNAVLGGNWYVYSVVINPNTDSGAVTYEDGHIQEKRDFSYTLRENGEVSSLLIK